MRACLKKGTEAPYDWADSSICKNAFAKGVSQAAHPQPLARMLAPSRSKLSNQLSFYASRQPRDPESNFVNS